MRNICYCKMVKIYWKYLAFGVILLLLSGIVVNFDVFTGTSREVNVLHTRVTESHRNNLDIRNMSLKMSTDSSKVPGSKMELVQNKIRPSSTDKIPSSAHALQPVRHIGFLKIHKAASSTMQNMFFRYGLKNNLTFVFTTHPNYFSRGLGSHIPLVKPKYRDSYDILCNHGFFDYSVYSSLLPPDTVYIGIVRDPLTLFVSAVNYYSQPSQLLPYLARIHGNRLQNLVRFPDRYDSGFFTYTKNSMTRDFGFSPTSDESRMTKRFNELDRILKIVLLVEHLEESLVLMKRYLHWNLEDILFLSNNVYVKDKGSSVSDLTPSDIELFKKRNNMDYRVYDFFYKRFWRQFDAESDDINSEVLNFKQTLKRLNSFCNGDNSSKTLIIQKTQWNTETTVTSEHCKHMQMDELKFIVLLRQLQGSELPGHRNT